MILLYSDAYLSLQHHPEAAHVRLVRSGEHFGSVSRVSVSMRACAKALEKIDASELGLLLDWRLSPLTTDAVLLKHVVQQSDLFAAAFPRRALLVATPVGLMQSQRIGRTINHAKPVVFDNESEALAYVKGRRSEEH
jgi:hypothetical protein